MRRINRTKANARKACPTKLKRFQNGPCGIFSRWASPTVSASAPQEQIQPQYAPLPHLRTISGMMTKVWISEMTSHVHIGWDVKTFQKNSGHARMKPNARQYSRPCSV